MKRILIVSDNDFRQGKKILLNLKPEILSLEKETDDIFYLKDNKIICFKARNNTTGQYLERELIEYLLS